LESQIIVAAEEKLIREEDLQFHLQLLDELGGFESEKEEVLIEIIEPKTPRLQIVRTV
jgi:hypothetical protein